MNLCLVCGKETRNKKYCSRSCSAVNSNRVSPKVKMKTRHCKKCGIEISRTRATLCLGCNKQHVDWGSTTLEEVKLKRKYQPYSRIRDLARYNYEFKGICFICGYSKHTELHHIKPISSFDDAAKIGEINGSSNLVELCPNCHWEADNGLLIF